MGIIDQYVMTDEAELQDFKRSEWTRIMSKSLDSYQEVRPDGGVSGAYGKKSIYRITPQGDDFLQDVYLMNTLSTVSGGNGSEKFIDNTALNMIDSIEIRHRGRTIWQLNDMSAPAFHIRINTKDEKDLEHMDELTNRVTDGTRNTQATTDGVTTCLKLDQLCPLFSHPLPLSLLSGEINIEIRYKQLNDVVYDFGAGPITGTIDDSYLQVNFITPNPKVVRYAKDLRDGRIRNGGNSVSYGWFGHEFLHTAFPVSNSTLNTANIVGDLADKNVMLLYFALRKNANDISDPHSFEPIKSWKFTAGGQEIDNMQTGEWTQEKFRTWYPGAIRVPNIKELKGTNEYFINYVEDMDMAFASDFSEIPQYHGSKSFYNVPNARLDTTFKNSTSGSNTLHVTALVPKYVVITSDGMLHSYD